MKYKILHVDPPWNFSNKNTGGTMKSGASAKYPTMSLKEMKALDVESITDENCVMFMWWVGSQPQEALDLVKEWGFTIKTMTGFNWVKVSEDKIRSHMINKLIASTSKLLKSTVIPEALEAFKYKLFFGMGFWTRAGSECCLIATKGKIKPIRKNIRSVVMAKIEDHSKKPDIFSDRIVELCGDLPRLEMFARDKKEGWDVCGNEVAGSIEISSKCKHLNYEYEQEDDKSYKLCNDCGVRVS